MFRVCFSVRNGSGLAEKWTIVNPCHDAGQRGADIGAQRQRHHVLQAGAYTRSLQSST